MRIQICLLVRLHFGSERCKKNSCFTVKKKLWVPEFHCKNYSETLKNVLLLLMLLLMLLFKQCLNQYYTVKRTFVSFYLQSITLL